MIFWRKFYPPDRTPVPRFAIPTAKYAVNEPEAWNCCPLCLKAELQKSSEEILHTIDLMCGLDQFPKVRFIG